MRQRNKKEVRQMSNKGYRKPLPPMTPEMWARYWCASWGIERGAKYRVTITDPTTTKRRFTGTFNGVNSKGELTFTGERTGLQFPLSLNVKATMIRVGTNEVNQ